MESLLRRLPAVVTAALVLNACGTKKELRTGVETSEFESAFASATPTAKSNVQYVVAAIKTNDYVGSILTLRPLTTDFRLSPQQRGAAKNVMIKIQAILAAAADKGDAHAQKAIEEFERRTRGQPSPR